MPLEDLPDGFAVPTRAEIRDRFQKDYALRQPGAPTGEGSQAYIDGSVIADTLMPIYADAVSVGRGADLADMTREQLKAECRAIGIPEELPESAGSGFVLITASAGGVFIDTGRELKDDQRNLRFHCASADTYYDGGAVPVIGTDTGPQTNIAAGARLRWTNPPSGLGAVATVQEDADGNGFIGGRVAETDDDIRARIEAARSDPPAGGNVAHVRDLVKRAGRDLGIAVQEVFAYPAITGSGHYAYVFTLRPGSPGSSRIPTAAQVAAVRAYVMRALPEDDGIFSAEVIEDEITVKLGITWAPNAEGWVDANPWPPYSADYYVSAVTDATTFSVKSIDTSAVAPQAGQVMGFYDRTNGKFAKKKVLSATFVVDEYEIVVDTTNNSSDPNYLPTVSERMCPYSPSLDLIVEPLLNETDTLGPGEQVASFFDEGYRQKRIPLDPFEWPASLRHNHIDQVDDLEQILDVDWLEPSIPYGPPTGVAGVSSNLIAIDVLLAFPL